MPPLSIWNIKLTTECQKLILGTAFFSVCANSHNGCKNYLIMVQTHAALDWANILLFLSALQLCKLSFKFKKKQLVHIKSDY